jgi:hypothetical protein
MNDFTRRVDGDAVRFDSPRPSSIRRGALIYGLNRFAESILGLGALIALVFMVAVLAAGMYELYVAIKDFFWHPMVTIAGAHGAGAAVASVEDAAETTNAVVIGALEMFILAPIPYLTLVSLQFYVSRFIGFTVIGRSGDGQAQEQQSSERMALLPKIKALIASMLVSLVAVHLVGAVLKSEVTWRSVAPQLAIIIVLGAYFILLERMAHGAHGGRSPHEE